MANGKSNNGVHIMVIMAIAVAGGLATAMGFNMKSMINLSVDYATMDERVRNIESLVRKNYTSLGVCRQADAQLSSDIRVIMHDMGLISVPVQQP